MANVARFTDLLFADQSLDELLVSRNRDEFPLQANVWTQLTEAAACLRRDERTRASELLLAITGNSNTETRVLLWSWTALRGLGVHPMPDVAAQIKGVVIQIPMGKGADVLAAYADGTARYVNHSGKIIVWDLPDAHMGNIVHKVLERSKNLNTDEAIALADRPDDAVRVTIMTFNGNRYAETPMRSLQVSPINQVLTVGAELMVNLIKRTEAMNRLMQQPFNTLDRGSEGTKI
jgi:hypothetical protein